VATRDVEKVKNPAAKTAGHQNFQYMFSVTFPLAGNPSDFFGIARKILDKPE
jgi:hypothetical protein